MAREALYHYLTGFPGWFGKDDLNRVIEPTYAPHALVEASMDRYGPIECPAKLDLGKFNLIEIAVDLDWPRVGHTRRVTKIVMRGPLEGGPKDAKRDLVFVMRYGRDGKPCIITLWSNLKTDQHKTLRKDRYRATEVNSPAPAGK